MQEAEAQLPGWSLGAEDPPVVDIFNTVGRAQVIFLCDHASNAIPRALHGLGLDEQLRQRHIAWDIGTLQLGKHLSSRFDAPLVSCGFSRLVIDANRRPGHPQSIPQVSDGFDIPGNMNLGEAEIRYRTNTFFKPYHRAIDKRIRHMRERGLVPALVSIHSFTPALRCNTPRPWHIGVLWNKDPRIAIPLLNRLATTPGVNVGDNQPYHYSNPEGYTLPLHAGQQGYPHVLIEVRKDLIRTSEGVQQWAGVLADALAEIISDAKLYRIEHYKND